MRVKWTGKTNDLVLTNGRIYDVISIEKGWYRIVDDSGDDYLYPPEQFEVVEDDEVVHDEPPRTIHLRCGIILTDHKSNRFIIAREDSAEYPIVFQRTVEDDPEYGYCDYYTLYKSALTAKEADEILEQLKEDNKRKANVLLKQYFKPEGILCEDVGEVRLDDAVPDEWYDAWEWMSGLITFRRDYPGYYEEDVEERGIW